MNGNEEVLGCTVRRNYSGRVSLGRGGGAFTQSRPQARRLLPGSRPSLLNPATLKAQAPDVYKVKFNTAKGDFVVQVTRAWSPLGADRFFNLVKNRFYDGAAFFRIVPGFVVQFGLSPDPAVSKAWREAKIGDDPVTQSNHRGYLSFATAGPGTRNHAGVHQPR